ncbi:hypothetical protein LJY25_19435 [Hymenobacter sp. BT175]|uniref:DUF7010 family protein n=1 Tax=Hymenobacter translucens TaxID=2886507 RepID=UPI001D0DE42F|nr:hypothetical protein [Hymenobacter translucens]MCC2548630.1 hypothetical protein [Hymenobacter translucens]
MLLEKDFQALKLELSAKAKNGLDFILAATLVWLLLTVIWTLPGTPTRNGFITFFVGALTLPLAWLFSKLLGTTWTIKSNPLQPLGLWLNFAQMFYFPFLIFIYSTQPQYFIMTYAIITGAHFFPYAWFYSARAYAVAAGVLPLGALFLGLRYAGTAPYLVPAFTAGVLLLLGVFLRFGYRKSRDLYAQAVPALA